MKLSDTGLVALQGTAVRWLLLHADELPADSGRVPHFLTPLEHDPYLALSVAKRRTDWLLGRYTAKRLVQSATNPAASLNTITIARRPDGSPTIHLGNDPPVPMTLSTSHSHDHAFCALVAGDGRPLGADLEWVEPRSPLFADDYFTESEQTTLHRVATGETHDRLVTAIWSGKEAALKAVRAGLTVDTRTVSCLFDPAALSGETWSPFEIVWRTNVDAGRPPLAGSWKLAGPFVLTLALAANDAVA